MGQENLHTKKDITVIGLAIMDMLVGPVTPRVFEIGSLPVKDMRFSFGGDALNEAIALTRMGKRVELVSKLGLDDAGDRIIDGMKREGLTVDRIRRENGLQTSMNIVLVDEQGERYFLTNPEGSLRKLAEKDVEYCIEEAADIVSFAGMFVSPLLDIPAMERLFDKIKKKPDRILVVDMTKAKQGERLKDLYGLLTYIDYFLPNAEEIALLTGEKDPYRNAELLIEAGVGCAVIKCGADGCLIRTKEICMQIPAYPVKHVVDTTGAGDCFAAGFLWGLSQKMPLQACGQMACAVASCSVEQMGAVNGIQSIEKPIRRYHEIIKNNTEGS